MELAIGHSLTTHESMGLDAWRGMARHAEDCGFDAITFADVLTRNLEMTVGLTLLATATTRMRIIATVTNPITRHPAVAAAAFASLHHITGGRVAMGISTGDSALHNVGRGPARLDDVRAYVAAFRALLADGEATYRGARCRLPWAPRVVDAPVAVLIGAKGPRSLALAGEIGDGVVTGQGFTPAAIAETLAHIARGAERSGRSVEDLDVWFHGPVSVQDDREQAIADVLDEVVGAARMPGMSPFAAEPDADPDLLGAYERLADGYDLASHAAVGSGGGALATELGLREALVERLAIVGSEEEVARRLRDLEGLGVRRLFATGLVPDPATLIERLARARG